NRCGTAFGQELRHTRVGVEAGGAFEPEEQSCEPLARCSVKRLFLAVDLVNVLQASSAGRDTDLLERIVHALVDFKVTARRDALNRIRIGVETDVTFRMQAEVTVVSRPRCLPRTAATVIVDHDVVRLHATASIQSHSRWTRRRSGSG